MAVTLGDFPTSGYKVLVSRCFRIDDHRQMSPHIFITDKDKIGYVDYEFIYLHFMAVAGGSASHRWFVLVN
jgi:hypothetical protein